MGAAPSKKINSFNFNHFYYFYITAKLEGVTAASRHLHTSQSSLSMQLKTLERTLGQKLFKKVGRRMHLTNKGREVFAHCKSAFRVFEEMADRAQRSENSVGAKITIGVASDLDRPFVAELMARAVRKYTDDRKPMLNLLSLPIDKLEKSLKLGEADMLLTNKFNLDQEIEVFASLSLPVQAFAAKKISDRLRNIPFGELCRSDTIGFSLPSGGTSLRAEIDTYFGKKRASPRIQFESNVISTVVRASVEGMGIVIVPSAYVTKEVRAGQLFSLSEASLWKHQLLAISRKDRLDDGRTEFLKRISSELGLLVATKPKKRKT